MSLREEQCKKVCRILDNALANRPTERDSLIVATRNAFSEPHWIPCSDGLPKEEGFYLVTLEDKCGAETTIRFFRIENGERQWSLWGNENITAWMPKPEPYKEVIQSAELD
jgi:hypothetical protein